MLNKIHEYQDVDFDAKGDGITGQEADALAETVFDSMVNILVDGKVLKSELDKLRK